MVIFHYPIFFSSKHLTREDFTWQLFFEHVSQHRKPAPHPLNLNFTQHPSRNGELCLSLTFPVDQVVPQCVGPFHFGIVSLEGQADDATNLRVSLTWLVKMPLVSDRKIRQVFDQPWVEWRFNDSKKRYIRY
jgi:hypothetical protein